MGLGEKLNSFLQTTAAPGTVGSDRFPEPDLKWVRQEIKPEAKGEEDGKANQPGAQSSQLSATELAIKARMEQYRKSYIDTYEAEQKAYRTRIDKAISLWMMDDIAEDEDRLVRRPSKILTAGSARIFELQDNLKAKSAELLNFRRANGLMHRTADTKDFYAALIPLLVCFIIEVGFTFLFIREAGDFSSVLVYAIVFCIVNCGLPFALGHPVRYIYYRAGQFSWGRFSGFLLLACTVIYALILNLAMGHYRGVAQEVAEKTGSAAQTIEGMQEAYEFALQTGRIAWERLLEQHFVLGDVQAYMLVIIGLTCLGISLREGLTYDDVYPGYGKKARAYEDAFADYDDEIKDFLDELDKDWEKNVDVIRMIKNQLQKTMQEVPEIINRALENKSRGESAIKVLNSRYQQLIEEYRGANRRVRTEDPPAYFNQAPLMDEVELTPPEFPEIDSSIRDAHARLVKRVESFSDELNSEYKRVQKKVIPAQKVLDHESPQAVS